MKTYLFPVFAVLVLAPSCGQKEKKENKDLRSENETLRSKAETARQNEEVAKSQSEAAKKGEVAANAEAQAAKARAAEALAQLNAAESDSETLRLNLKKLEADLTRLRETQSSRAEDIAALEASITTLKSQITKKDSEIKALKDASARAKGELAILPFDGIWIAEVAPSEGVPAKCSVMTKVTSQKTEITRAVVCEDGTAQVDTFSPSNYGVRADLFPSSLGFAVSVQDTATSCGSLTTSIPKTSEFIFDHSTVSGGERATYMFASFGSDNIVFQNGSSIAELGRNKSCDLIVQRASETTRARDVLLQGAARLCQNKLKTTGCFTSAGFKAVR